MRCSVRGVMYGFSKGIFVLFRFSINKTRIYVLN